MESTASNTATPIPPTAPTPPTSKSSSVSTVTTIIFLIFFWPIGIFLMWLWTKWPKWLKIVLSLVALVLTVLIAIEVVAIITAINPDKQFGISNDAKRRSDVLLIVDAINQYRANHQGQIPKNLEKAADKSMAIGTGFDKVDLCVDLKPYLSAMPMDPRIKGAEKGVSDCSRPYTLGYSISYSSTTGEITVSATPYDDRNPAISVTR